MIAPTPFMEAVALFLAAGLVVGPIAVVYCVWKAIWGRIHDD